MTEDNAVSYAILLSLLITPCAAPAGDEFVTGPICRFETTVQARTEMPETQGRRSDADRGGTLPAGGFDQIQKILNRGAEVVVRDAAGRKTRGRVSMISVDRLSVMATPRLRRLFGRTREHSFAASAIDRIDSVDSGWQGALIGAAVAPALIYGVHRWEDERAPETSSAKGLVTIVGGGVGTVLSIWLGRAIDRSINQPIYERRRQPRRIAVGPLLRRGGAGVSASVGF